MEIMYTVSAVSGVRIPISPPFAGVMELADVVDSKSTGSDTVPVRVRPPAPCLFKQMYSLCACRLGLRNRHQAVGQMLETASCFMFGQLSTDIVFIR